MSLQFRENIWAMQQTFFQPLPQTVQNPLVCIHSKMFRRISFLTFYTYLFCHISGRRGEKWKNMKCLFFDWDFSYTYIYISVTELWNWLCFAKRVGGSICLWLGQKLFCWLQFFSLFFFLPGVFTKMICKQIGYENSIELWDFLC